MEKSVLLLYILIINNLYANDAWVNSSGGSFVLLNGKNPDIQMASETIKIDLYNNYYEMDIEFHFLNFGETIELQVGFPEYTWGTTDTKNISNFETTVNNKKVNFEVIQNPNFSPAYNSNSSVNIKSWHVRNVVFEANGYTITRVRYRTDYSGSGSYDRIEYLYGTGSTRNYFNSQRWYRINNNFSENLFSANERINLEYIIREENRRN